MRFHKFRTLDGSHLCVDLDRVIGVVDHGTHLAVYVDSNNDLNNFNVVDVTVSRVTQILNERNEHAEGKD